MEAELPHRTQIPCAEEDGLIGDWMVGPGWSLSLPSAGGARHLLCRPHNKADATSTSAFLHCGPRGH